jgi:hypothetical protein
MKINTELSSAKLSNIKTSPDLSRGCQDVSCVDKQRWTDGRTDVYRLEEHINALQVT